MPDAELQSVVLLAAFRGDLIDTLIPVLFVVIWIVTQVINAFRNAAKAPPAPARPPQPRPAPPQPAGQGRPPELDREIEELLRRTLGVEPVRQAPSPPRPPKPPRPRQNQKPQNQEAAVSPRMAQPVSRGSRDDVARHVEEAFARDLAHASPSGTAAQSVAAVAAAPSADLIASLRSPETLRQLIIVREILEVPTHRW
jgi:hypothetical protein